jgi:hypothetical protein
MRSRPNSSRWSEARSWRRCSGTIPILLTVRIRERLRTRSPDDESHKEDLRGRVPQRRVNRPKSWGSEPEWAFMDGTRDRVHLSVSRFPGPWQLAQKVGDIAETAGLVLRGSGVSITGRRSRQKHE